MKASDDITNSSNEDTKRKDYKIAEVPVSGKSGTMLAEELDAETLSDSTDTVYSEEDVKAIALDHAGLEADEVTFILVHPDLENGREVYDVEFYVNNKEYDYEIDVLSGEILSYDYDMESEYTAGISGKENSSSRHEKVNISMEEAKKIALKKAGVSEKIVTYTEASLEYDDGLTTYQIDFVSGANEYDVEINAITGAVVEYDVESIYD